MHQRKDWKTYARFANSLTTECPDLEGIIACGTDGEKALILGFNRDLNETSVSHYSCCASSILKITLNESCKNGDYSITQRRCSWRRFRRNGSKEKKKKVNLLRNQLLSMNGFVKRR